MELSRREVVVAALGACLLSIVMTWPLLIHLGDVVPRDIGDPLAEAWQPAWGGHALIHQPLHYFDANRFWPLKDSLAFGDALIGYAPTGIIGRGPHAAMVRYDLLFLFAYALAFFGAYLLARELGLSPAGAAIAGAAFAFAPYRLEQDGHLQVISSGGIPLAIAFAVRGIRLKRPWWLFWAWVVAAWQVSIGWVLGLPFAYGLGGAVAIGVVAWLVRSRPPLPRPMLIAGAAGAVLFIAVSYWIAHPYLYIADNFPASRRSPHEVAAFSGPLKVLLTAPEENWVWGSATAGIRNSLTTLQEKTLFPGAVIVLLSLRRPLVEQPEQANADRARDPGRRDHRPGARFPRGGRASLALPSALRRPARLGRDPHARPPGDVLVARSRPARGGGRRGAAASGAPYPIARLVSARRLRASWSW